MNPRLLHTEQLLAREQELIETALSIMARDGTAGLTMDKVVARVPYSKGTVYNHFCSREDLLTGVCNAGMETLAGLFARAAAFPGSTRERLLAIHYAYLLHAQRDPTKFMLVISAKTANLIERTSERRLAAHYELEGRLMAPMLELVEEAIATGELTPPAGMSRQQIVFTNWAGSFGVISLLINSKDKCRGRTGLDSQVEIFNHAHLLLDGLRWRPLSREWDYAATQERIMREVFPREAAQVDRLTAGERRPTG
ncbi:TetR/AcrR family transcriptional regulator [Sedimenticola hydrogenitrophicus]|uniref:TetR/AcrR family transcriptional regulator n=1 Tax=Sedimenticola hydrogenitrophicus TaxID=2967975 RepID=UPI0023B1FBAB|nr:TetR/AcrR family transcriptional regulator [Sedimenticola hydrogenitrophicus]